MRSRKGIDHLVNRWRGILRVALALVAMAAVLAIAGAGMRMMLGHDTAQPAAQPQTAPVGPNPPKGGRSLRQTLLGIYLSLRQGEIEQAANPADERVVSFTVAPGETASTIGPRLEQAGLIRDGELFRLLVRYRGVDSGLEAGDYQLSPSMTLDRIVTELQHGGIRSITVMIPEGWRMEQIAAKLAEAGLGKEEEFLALMRKNDYPYSWLQDRPEEAPEGLEGFLFPDTYQFRQDAKPEYVIDTMLTNFDRRVTPELRAALAGHGLSFYQAIVLASIVEREAVVAQERPLIAAVFYGRLQQGMYLQADPTVSYAKGFDPDKNTWWAPMYEGEGESVESAYNTFLHPGLTPGPICNPGLASIEAVAYPATTKYLYFVSRGDGSHAFAETFEEHLENVRKYQ